MNVNHSAPPCLLQLAGSCLPTPFAHHPPLPSPSPASPFLCYRKFLTPAYPLTPGPPCHHLQKEAQPQAISSKTTSHSGFPSAPFLVPLPSSTLLSLCPQRPLVCQKKTCTRVNHHQALPRPMQTSTELPEVLCKLIDANIACGATGILLASTARLPVPGTGQNIEQEPSASPKPTTGVQPDREDSSLCRRKGEHVNILSTVPHKPS